MSELDDVRDRLNEQIDAQRAVIETLKVEKDGLRKTLAAALKEHKP